MKILFIDTYYSKFLTSLRNTFPNLSKKSYEEQKQLLLNQFFGTSDFFSHGLRKNGWIANDIIANDEILQRRWVEEKNIKVNNSGLIAKLQSLPYIHRLLGKPTWTQEIALAQVIDFKPDIVYMQDLSILNPDTLKKVKKHCKLLVGQIACPLPPKENLKCFDLIITSFPHYVKIFQKMGIKSVYQKLAFEERILKIIKPEKRAYDVSFIGSFTPYHSGRTKLLEEVAKVIPIHIWGQGLEFLSPFSPLRKNFHGEAWGKGMYNILAKSKIVINSHIGVAGDYANNMRLYEATGMGAMLITDKKKNLNEIFKIGIEVEVYNDANDLKNKLTYYLTHNSELYKIAINGQKRTLKDHSYKVRMRELSGILKKTI